MTNSRIYISILAFLSGFMMICLLIYWTAIGPANISAVGSFKFGYYVCMFVLFSYFWIYFYRRPRGSRTLLDGRTALSGCGFVVGVATGYAFIEFEIIPVATSSEPGAGGFATFVGLTMLPIMAWLAIYALTLYQRKAALRSEAKS